MLPTLNGRIQTRIFVLGFVGLVVALIITPFIRPSGSSLADGYLVTFSVLVATVIVGIGWEFVYHLLQQFRWEKDWPTLFGLITVVNEGALMWVLVEHTGVVVPQRLTPSTGAFLIQFLATWLGFWLLVNGPIRIVFHRWRFSGGRFL
ncbi:hypothetical protein [Aldersonia kunmingensis]|uniref:hypothetical protein n=1 Tax=Aldersonia kunmingensis TaxID=408066 RepID=UPI0008374283|nr:hypothetical protein [Aldersonia kunmingensis]